MSVLNIHFTDIELPVSKNRKKLITRKQNGPSEQRNRLLNSQFKLLRWNSVSVDIKWANVSDFHSICTSTNGTNLISATFGKASSVYRLFRDVEITRLPHPSIPELQIRKTVDHHVCVLPYVIVIWRHFEADQNPVVWSDVISTLYLDRLQKKQLNYISCLTRELEGSLFPPHSGLIGIYLKGFHKTSRSFVRIIPPYLPNDIQYISKHFIMGKNKCPALFFKWKKLQSWFETQYNP